jgi:hypothetical protein
LLRSDYALDTDFRFFQTAPMLMLYFPMFAHPVFVIATVVAVVLLIAYQRKAETCEAGRRPEGRHNRGVNGTFCAKTF